MNTRLRNETGTLLSTFGALVGLIGVEHGLGELLQGNAAPTGLMFPSWPGSAFFSVLGGEPALSILPNLLVTGLLAIFFSLLYLAWATLWIRCRHAGLVLILLSIAMLLFGGGVFPPLLGALIGAATAGLKSSPGWLTPGWRPFLAKLWPWAYVAGLLAWLGMLPGIPLLAYFWRVDNPDLILVLLVCMFAFPGLALAAGLARDARSGGPASG